MNNYFRLIVGICVFSSETLRVVFGAAYSARMTMVNRPSKLEKLQNSARIFSGREGVGTTCGTKPNCQKMRWHHVATVPNFALVPMCNLVPVPALANKARVPVDILAPWCALDYGGLVYNSPSPTSQAMTSLMTSSIEVGGERRSHTKFGDDVTITS